MLVLPPNIQRILGASEIPKDLRMMPNHVLLRFVIWIMPSCMEWIPDVSDKTQWQRFKSFFGQRVQAMKIKDVLFIIYEKPEVAINILARTQLLKELSADSDQLLIKCGFGDLVGQKLSHVDPGRVAEFADVFLTGLLDQLSESELFDTQYEDQLKEQENYWRNVHQTLSTEERLKVETELQYWACICFSILHNAISVMAYRETLSALVQKALRLDEGSDEAMIKAVRIDNTLREHPVFHERYLQACKEGDAHFLKKYANLEPPVSGKIKYPGTYLLLAFLDTFGLLKSLSDPQLVELNSHANLDKWQNTIYDTNSLAKLRIKYEERKISI